MDHKEAAIRGVRTAVQAVVGALIGLLVVVWQVPGVPEATASYALNNFVPVALALGVPAGIVGYVYNLVRPR